MASSNDNIIKGRVLYVDKNTVWLASGRRLMSSRDQGETWQQRSLLPINGVREVLSIYSLGRRLGRVGFHHLEMLKENPMLILAHNHIFQLEIDKINMDRVASIVGSRPMKICVAKEFIYYGEYRSNPERSAIHIWAAKLGDPSSWKPVWRFENVRHVHGVFFDPYSSSIWITTGDKNNESAIWVTHDNFKTLDWVVGGSQKFRSTHLLFTNKYIYFGSDTPDEKNYIYRMSRISQKIERLTSVGSSVFHGCKVKNKLFFSTAVEPSEINTTSYADIWGSSDGVNWYMVGRFIKDIWPMKYFQYGQVLFPAGPGDGRNLWYTPMATEYDQKTFKIPIDTLFF